MEIKNLDFDFSEYRFADVKLERCTLTTISPAENEKIYINKGCAFIIITKGKANITYSDKKYILDKGHAAVIPCISNVLISPVSSENVSFIIVKIIGESVRKIFNIIENKESGIVMNITTDPKIADTAVDLISECTKNFRSDYSLLCSFYEFLKSIDDHYIEKIIPSKNIYISKAVEYIKKNYNKNINVESIAVMLGIERSYLSRLFKTHKNKSTQNYIIDFRIEQAKRMFEEEDMNVSQVSSAVGYNNIYCFSRIFKSRVGMPPKEYMEKCRKR